jgi:hypothetical protein
MIRVPNDETVAFKCPAALARAADRAATEKMLSRSAWIRGVVAEHLRSHSVPCRESRPGGRVIN